MISALFPHVYCKSESEVRRNAESDARKFLLIWDFISKVALLYISWNCFRCCRSPCVIAPRRASIFSNSVTVCQLGVAVARLLFVFRLVKTGVAWNCFCTSANLIFCHAGSPSLWQCAPCFTILSSAVPILASDSFVSGAKSRKFSSSCSAASRELSSTMLGASQSLGTLPSGSSSSSSSHVSSGSGLSTDPGV